LKEGGNAMTLAKALPLALLVFLGASQSMLRAASCINDADCIQAGSDLFVTQPGTFFTINGNAVPLKGIPDASGADTIVQRLGTIDVTDSVNSTGMVSTQMTELNLTGVDGGCPTAGGGPCQVYINLNASHPTLGTLTFTQTAAAEAAVEGTFTSFFDVFFDLSFSAGVGAPPIPCAQTGTCNQELTLTGTGSWTDDNGQFFVVGGQVQESHPMPPGLHIAQQITTPEPGFVFLNLALVGVLLAWRFRRSKETSL
jgi:hypothetical protein